MTETDRRADVPEALKPLVARIIRDAAPLDIWLFGSRARGEARADSDLDLLAVLPDDADDALLDPVFGWRLQRDSGIRADVIMTKRADLGAVWGIPNTIGYVLAREGIRLNVGR
jgi:predicted nucleotidyltransferase